MIDHRATSPDLASCHFWLSINKTLTRTEQHFAFLVTKILNSILKVDPRIKTLEYIKNVLTWSRFVLSSVQLKIFLDVSNGIDLKLSDLN
ncbi:hypothetical protein BpHYR1_024421 [Brachionus plicatilis]|uniref:Uncharacterized protein n=1 Tax=Brachionus plicatilis TaxID=10195 RepID=A0A3M7QI19_BRAPC|nr:hypothetical protein BpHYR1_024421 [Brachionus plicatilis]